MIEIFFLLFLIIFVFEKKRFLKLKYPAVLVHVFLLLNISLF